MVAGKDGKIGLHSILRAARRYDIGSLSYFDQIIYVNNHDCGTQHCGLIISDDVRGGKFFNKMISNSFRSRFDMSYSNHVEGMVMIYNYQTRSDSVSITVHIPLKEGSL